MSLGIDFLICGKTARMFSIRENAIYTHQTSETLPLHGTMKLFYKIATVVAIALAWMASTAPNLCAQFEPLQSVLSLSDPGYHLYTVDIENDGDADLCLLNVNRISVAVNNGNLQFTEQNLFDFTPFYPSTDVDGWWGVSFHDMDSDGFVDFVQNTGTSIEWRKNNGDLSFGTPQVLITIDNVVLTPEGLFPNDAWYSMNFMGMATGDTDLDGNQEVVIVNGVSANDPTFNFTTTYYNARIDIVEFVNGVVQPVQTVADDLNQQTIGLSNINMPFELMGYFSQCILEDLSGDGAPDLTVSFFRDIETKALSFYNNNGQFQNAYALSGGAHISNQYLVLNLDADPPMEMIDRGDFNFTAYQMPAAPASQGQAVPVSNYYDLEIQAGFFVGNYPSGRVIDLYADGHDDLVFASGDGAFNLLLNNQNGGFIGEYEGMFPGTFSLPQVTLLSDLASIYAIEVGDFNGDGKDDLAVLAPSEVYLFLAPTTAPPAPTLGTYIVSTYYDANGNEVHDANEANYPYNEYLINGQFNAFGVNPDFLLTADTGQINIQPLFNEQGFIAVPNSTTLNFDGLNDTVRFEFAIQSLNPAEVNTFDFFIGQVNQCEYSHISCLVTNTGNTILSGNLEVTLDPALIFQSASGGLTPLSQNGNVLTFGLPSVLPLSSYSLIIYTLNPGASVLGQTSETSAVLTVSNNFGETLPSSSDAVSTVYQCAYDPNYVEEFTGHTSTGYVFDGSTLHFMVHFQNTGNAAANTVRIEHALSNHFDMPSLRLLSASHAVVATIDDAGMATFTFDNIQLPDSASDPLGSQGYVEFNIDLLPGMNFLDEVNTVASIYFDNNEPIVTNTSLNTIYECADLANNDANDGLFCFGGSFTGGTNAVWVEEITWTYNTQSSNDEAFQFVADQTDLLQVQSSNALCSYNNDWAIMVDQPIVNMTVNGNELSATGGLAYQWYLNGASINGATEDVYIISATGNYSVQGTSFNGCTATTPGLNVTYIGIDESAAGSLNVYPNPCETALILEITDISLNHEVRIYDATGREVLYVGKLFANRTEIDVQPLPAGIYCVNYGTSSQRIVKK